MPSGRIAKTLSGGKDMKKLRTILVVLFALAMSMCLFACKGKKKPDTPVEPGPDDPVVEPDTNDTITSVSAISGFTSQITDSVTKAAWEETVASVTLTVSTRGGERLQLKGTDCTITTTADFGEPGDYTVTFRPKENNTRQVSRTEKLIIVHDWGDVVNGKSVCRHDQAIRQTTEEDVIIHYGTFHSGTNIADANVPSDVKIGTETGVYTNNKASTSTVSKFGTVTTNSGSVEVPTLTAGKLEQGMKITVRGQARTTAFENKFWKHKNEQWNSPNAGIADRGLNGQNSYSPNYVGGSSVIVRQEGWVLYDGIGVAPNPVTLSSIGGGIAGGVSPFGNYGSHKNATPDTKSPPPDGYVNGDHPDFDDPAWKTWWVYSEGSTFPSEANYADWTDLEISWEYLLDHDIVVITYTRNYKSSSAESIKAYIKVPSEGPTAGYYDTILHGDFNDMTISESEIITRRTPTDFSYKGLKDKATTVYAEGQALNFGDFVATATYEQSPDKAETKTIGAGDVYAYKGSKDKTTILAELKGNIDAHGAMDVDVTTADWEKLGADSGLLSSYEVLVIQVTMGGKTWGALVNGENGNLPFKIVPNAVGSALGMDSEHDSVAFPNDGKVGEFAFSVSEDAITLTLDGGYAHQLSDGQAEKLGVAAAEYRYIAIRLNKVADTATAFSASEVTVKAADETEVKHLVSVDAKGNAYLVLAVNKEIAGQDITVEGLQTTKIVLKVAGLHGFTVTTDHDLSGLVAFNKGGDIVLHYSNVPSNDTWAIVWRGPNITKSVFAESYKGRQLGSSGVIFKDYTAFDNGSFSITLTLPAKTSARDYKGETFELQLDGVTELVDVIDYNFTVDTTVEATNYYAPDQNTMIEVNGSNLYVSKLLTLEDITDTTLANGGSIVLNVNKGDKDAMKDLPLVIEYTVTDGVVTVKGDAAEVVTADVTLFGTLNDSADKDKGAIILFTVDLDALGARSGSEDFYLEYGKSEAQPTFVHKVSGSTFTKVALDSSKLTAVSIVDGDCTSEGTMAYEYKEGDTVLCYVGVRKVGGDHDFADGDTCVLCGATKDDKVTFALKANAHSERIETGHFVTVRGTLNNTTHGKDSADTWAVWTGVNTEITSENGDVYLVRPDNYITRNNVADFAGLEREYPQGIASIPDEVHGIFLSDGVFQDIKKEGSFEVTTSFADGVIYTGVMLFAKDNPIENRTPNAAFSFTISGVKGSYINTKVYLDDNGATGVKLNGNATVIKGEVAPSVISSIDSTVTVDGTAFTDAAEVTTNGSANGKTVVKADGLAGTLSADQKSKLNVTDEKYFLALSVKLTTAIAENSTVSLDGVKGYAAISADRKTIDVVAALDGLTKSFVIDLSNVVASTLQSDIFVDLASVRYYDVTSTVNHEGISFVTGGDITVTYTGTLPSGLQLVVNGEKGALEKNAVIGGATVKNWAENVLTLTLPKADLSEELPTYTIELVDGDGVLVNRAEDFDLAILPGTAAEGEILDTENNYYIRAEGESLFVVIRDDAGLHTNATKTLQINVNKGASSKAELVRNFDLTAKIDAVGDVSFPDNVLAATASGFYCTAGSAHFLIVEIDLSAVEIAASDAYGFELAVGDDVTSNDYFLVNASRKIEKNTFDATGKETVTVGESSCTSVGVKAYAIGDPVTFYYGLEIIPAHNYKIAENGGGAYVCETCGAVLKAGDVKGFTVPASLLAPKDEEKTLLDTGVSISFFANVAGGEGADWSAHAVTAAGVSVTLPNLDGWNNTVADLDGATAEEKALAAKVKSTHLWPGSVGAEKNGAGYDVFLNGTSYVTIVINATDGFSFYKNGLLVFEYTADGALQGDGASNGGTVGDQAELMLRLFSHTGITIGSGLLGASDLVIEAKTFTEEEALARYENYVVEHASYPVHTHSYSPDDDLCDCGALNPEHTAHKYSATTHKCEICGMLAPADNAIHDSDNEGKCSVCGSSAHVYENGICTVCGRVQPYSELTEKTDVNKSYTASGFQLDKVTLSDVSFKDGAKVVVYGTQTGDIPANYSTLNFRVNGGTNATNAVCRTDAYGWYEDDASVSGGHKVTVSTAGNVKTTVGKVEVLNWTGNYKEIMKDCTWRVELTWSGNTVTAVYTATANAFNQYNGYTFNCAYTIDLTGRSSATISFGAENSSFTVLGYVATGV